MSDPYEVDANDPTINTTARLTGPNRRDDPHVWRDGSGRLCGTLDFGNSNWIVYHDPAHVRELEAAVTLLRIRMETFPPAPPAEDNS